MKNKISAAILMTVLFFSVPVQPVLAEVPEEWRYNEDLFEYYWEDKEEEEAKRKQQDRLDAIRDKREWQAAQNMEEEAEKQKKDAAYEGEYVDFDDDERYLSGLEDEATDVYDNGDIDIMYHDEYGKTVVYPPYKIDSNIRKLLKECKRLKKRFKYSISNKNNTISMTESCHNTFCTFLLEKFQTEGDKLIGLQQNTMFKNFDFDAAQFKLTVYVTDEYASEYSYADMLFKFDAKNLLSYAKLYGMFLGANPDDLELDILDVYTEESYFSN